MVDEHQKQERLTPDKVRRQNLIPSPETGLDITAQLIVPQTGRAPIGQDLERSIYIEFTDYDGSIQRVSGWDLFTFITSDIRLSNLNYNDRRYVEWAMKCSLLCLQAGLKESAIMSMSLLLSVTEPGLGINAKLRELLQTIKQETQHIQIEDTPKKRSLLGFIDKKQG